VGQQDGSVAARPDPTCTHLRQPHCHPRVAQHSTGIANVRCVGIPLAALSPHDADSRRAARRLLARVRALDVGEQEGRLHALLHRPVALALQFALHVVVQVQPQILRHVTPSVAVVDPEVARARISAILVDHGVRILHGAAVPWVHVLREANRGNGAILGSRRLRHGTERQRSKQRWPDSTKVAPHEKLHTANAPH
jgi:hypothetical protein